VRLQDLLHDWKLRRGRLNQEIAYLDTHSCPSNDQALNELRGLALELDRLILQYGFDA